MVGDGWQITSQELCALPDHQELSKQQLASQLYQERHKWLASLTEAPLVIVRMGDEAAAHGGVSFQAWPQD
jgi:hypothetical protein